MAPHVVGATRRVRASSPNELGDLIQASVDVTKYVAFVAYGYNPNAARHRASSVRAGQEPVGVSPAGRPRRWCTSSPTPPARRTPAASSRRGFTRAWPIGWPAARRSPSTRGPGAGHAPRNDQFAAGTQGQIIQAYRDARSLIASLSRVAGPKSAFDLFVDLGKEQVRPGAQSYIVDQELQHVGVGGGLDGLEHRWIAGR